MKISAILPLARSVTLTIGLAVGALIAAPAAQAETLSDAMASAYKHSGLLDQNRAVLRAADEDVAQAVATLRPVLNYAGSTTYNFDAKGWTSSLSLTSSITLYDFGASQLGIDAAKETVLGTRKLLVGIEQNVLLNAVNAYFDVRETQAVVGLRASNVRLITQELRAAQDRFEVGEVTRTDVSLAEARLAAARSAEAAAKGNFAVARETYKAATGHYPGNLAAPPRPPQSAKSAEAARSVARKRHPIILASQHDVTVAELNILRARARTRPNISANATVAAGRSTTGINSTTETFGLSISGPIYQGGALRSLERQAGARRDAARAALLIDVQTVERNVGNAWAQLQVANASLDATSRQVRASRDAFAGVQEEAKLGARTTLDLLDAEQELLDAQVSAISAEIGRYRAVYTVLSSMGLLTVSHLGLGVPQYDPAAYYNAVKTAPLHGVSPQGEKLDRVLKSLGRN
ncbi:MAG: outer membrane protein [Halocynthiibacter sp.]|jgi:outer membrane protein